AHAEQVDCHRHVMRITPQRGKRRPSSSWDGPSGKNVPAIPRMCSTGVLGCARGVEMNRVIRAFVEVPVYSQGGHVETRIHPIAFDPAARAEIIGHVSKQALGLAQLEESMPPPA